MDSKPIYQIHAELHGYMPKIWRRFLVQDDVTMANFARIIMTLFEMDGSHMFAFEIPVPKNLKIRAAKAKTEEDNIALQKFEWLTGGKNVRIQTPTGFDYDFIGDYKSIDPSEVTLSNIFAVKSEKAVFNYDFGDDWRINIKIEKIITVKESGKEKFPCVTAGEGYGIIEDCGGIWGLGDIAEAFEEGSGEEYENYVEWLGGEDFDLISFDIEEMNSRL